MKLNEFRHKVSNKLVFKKQQLPNNLRIVSFTFDDVPISAFENGASILNDKNKKGTFYLSHNLINNSISEQLIEKTIQDNHEIACHTYSHCRFYKTFNPYIIQEEIKRNQKYFKGRFEVELKNFAYPYGQQTIISKYFVKANYHTGRSIHEGTNQGIIDIYNLKSIKLYEYKHSIDKILNKYEGFYNNAWVIFHTHDVIDKHSQFGCSPSYFDKILSYMIENEFICLNIEQAYELINQNSLN